jgi:hypothetical protein
MLWKSNVLDIPETDSHSIANLNLITFLYFIYLVAKLRSYRRQTCSPTLKREYRHRQRMFENKMDDISKYER